MRVFLGGTVSDSKWREHIITELKELGIDWWNPVSANVHSRLYQDSYKANERMCDVLLYVVTPRMKAFESIAEAVDNSNKFRGKVVYCVLETDSILYNHYGVDGPYPMWPRVQYESLIAIGKRIENNGGRMMVSLEEVITFLKSTKHKLDGLMSPCQQQTDNGTDA